jgi:hypothetical protein
MKPSSSALYWNIDLSPDIQSTTTYAMSVKHLSIMFPQPEFDCWGPDDPWNMTTRVERSVRTITSQSFVCHQPRAQLRDWPLYNDRVTRPGDFMPGVFK